MDRQDARRASEDVGRGISRVASLGVVVDGSESVDKWTRVGRWAWAGEREGFGCVRRTMLRGWGLSSPVGDDEEAVIAVPGAFLAAKASRCRVTLFRPMRRWFLRAGGGGGGGSS